MQQDQNVKEAQRDKFSNMVRSISTENSPKNDDNNNSSAVKATSIISDQSNTITTVEMLKKYGWNLLGGLVFFLLGYLGFSVLWILLVVLGIEVHRRKREKKKARLNVAKTILEHGEEEWLKFIGVELPGWVNFGGAEKAEWLNSLVINVWPHIGAAAWRVVKEKVEPMAQEIMAGHRVSGFKFQRVELGRIPPRIEGVLVHSGKKDEVILDIDLMYNGDSRVQISLMKINAGVSDLHLSGRLRVVFKLVDSIPIIGGIQIYFLDTPKLDFEFDGAANILEIPGINGLLQDIIMDQVRANLVRPNKLTIPIGGAICLQELLMPQPAGLFVVKVLEADDLPKNSQFMDIDPYCVLTLGANRRKTSKKDGKSPRWDEVFMYPMDLPDEQELKIELFDSDKLSEDDFLGETLMEVGEVAEKKGGKDWYKLGGVETGWIHLETAWLVTTADAQESISTMGASGMVSIFVGNINLNLKRLPTLIKLEISINGETKESKDIMEIEKERGKFAVNEGYVFVIEKIQEELEAKIINVDEDEDLGTVIFNVADLQQKDELTMNVEHFTVDNSKVDAGIEMAFKLRYLAVPKDEEPVTSSVSKATKKMTDGLFKGASRSKQTLSAIGGKFSRSRDRLADSSKLKTTEDERRSTFYAPDPKEERRLASIPPKPPRTDLLGDDGSVEGDNKIGKKIRSLNAGFDSFRHIDSEPVSLISENTGERLSNKNETFDTEEDTNSIRQRIGGGFKSFGKF